jgi:hypothetical protein
VKLKLSAEERSLLLAYLAASTDCEKLAEGEWVADLYEVETPVSLDLVFKKESVFADGAEYLTYDEEADGYYLSGPVESSERVTEILRAAGALGK